MLSGIPEARIDAAAQLVGVGSWVAATQVEVVGLERGRATKERKRRR
jgi:hypothetical protein